MPRNTARSALPSSWSESAATTYLKIRTDNPDLDSAGTAALYEACNLLATADTMQARVDTDGLLSIGSQGQPVAHPLIAEVRLARVQALAALKTLTGAPSGGSAASRAGSALATARHQRARTR